MHQLFPRDILSWTMWNWNKNVLELRPEHVSTTTIAENSLSIVRHESSLQCKSDSSKSPIMVVVTGDRVPMQRTQSHKARQEPGRFPKLAWISIAHNTQKFMIKFKKCSWIQVKFGDLLCHSQVLHNAETRHRSLHRRFGWTFWLLGLELTAMHFKLLRLLI